MRAEAGRRLVVLAVALTLAAGCGAGEEAPRDGRTGRDSSSAAGDGPARAGPLWRPGSPEMTRAAPDSFRVRFRTSAGAFTVAVHRAWAPRGADRLYNLARHGYYDGARFFRVVEGFVAQFGLASEPELSRVWARARIRDDPVRKSNRRGFVSFAAAGPDSRTTQLFVNLADNTRLDSMGFAPVGRVVRGMEVVDRLHSGYGERPSQREILRRGEAYLAEEFPELDVIREAEVLAGPDGAGGGGARRPSAGPGGDETEG